MSRTPEISRQVAAPSPARQPRLGPYSRRLHRGAVGDSIDGRSALGRFIRNLEAELVEHVGGRPSVTQRMLIERAIKFRLQLDAFDTKMASGTWTPHDGRTYAGVANAFRLTMRELGLKAAPKPKRSIAEYLAAEAQP